MPFYTSNPLIEEEFRVPKKSIHGTSAICRFLCLYYFFTLKWFEGELVRRKLKEAKMPAILSGVYVYPQTGTGFILTELCEVVVCANMHHPGSWLNKESSHLPRVLSV